MKKVLFLSMLLSFIFSSVSSADEVRMRKCSGNLDLIKTLKDNGVIKDSKYLSILDLLKSAKTDPLAKKRRELKVNSAEFDARIGRIEKLKAGKTNDGWNCIYDSAELIRNLSAYADFASNSKAGLDKFVSGWQAKAAIYGPEATDLPPPASLPPALK